MADPISIGGGIVGVIGLAIQITQVVVQSGLNWKDAPDDVKMFMAELQTLKTVLSETRTNLVLNTDFVDAFQNRPSLLLSQLGSQAASATDGKILLEVCEKQLKDLVKELEKRAKGHRVGWERLKGAFLAKNTRESVENLHRQCEALNHLVSIDTAVLGVTTYKEVKDIRREQQEAREEYRKWHHDETVTNLLNWFAPADYGAQQSDLLGRRQEGTGEWLLGSSKFQTWCNGNSSTLFCPGMPGAGKTIMTSIVVDYLCTKFREDASVGIAYLYCNFRRRDEQRPADLLASVLRQFIERLPNTPISVQCLYEYHRDRHTRPLVQEILKELQSVVGTHSKCFVIVDALDECSTSEGGRQTLLTGLFGLRAKGGVNLFATSRHIPQIVQEFKGKSTTLEIRASDEDVRRYLNGHMKRLPSYVLRNADLQEEIETEIVKAVQGMFLLAKLHLDSLVGLRSAKALRTALAKLPKGSDAYNEAYRDAMNRINGQISSSQELALQTLAWITYARRPLTTSELRHALAVEVSKCEFEEDNLPDIEDVVSVCAGLVSVDEESDVIRLVHYTTQKFFERTRGDWFPDAHKDIAVICVTYLSFDIFRSGSCPSDDELEARLRRNPLYEYAARNWGCHIRGTFAEMAESTLHLLENEMIVSACSQALMVADYRYSGYSQRVSEFTGTHLAAYFGLPQVLALLLERGNQSDCKDSGSRTPLSWAAELGQEAVVKLLVERDDVETDSKDQSGQTPLSWAAVWGREAVVKLLVERDDVEADSKDQRGRTPLSWAAELGREAVVKLLVERDDVEADSKDQRGRTPLSWAAAWGEEAVVKLLVERDDVEADSKDQNGRTPLSWAAELGQEVVVKLLVERDDVEADSKNDDGRTPLACAAARGQVTTLKLLLARNTVNPNAQDRYGGSPLLLASGNGHEVAVEVLLAEATVDFVSKDNFHRTPLSWASRKGLASIVKQLRESYHNQGLTARDGELDVALSPTTASKSDLHCDICLCWVPNTNYHYHCRTCSHGDFDICQECLEYGAFCFNDSHQLTKRIIKKGGLVKDDDSVEV